MTLYAITCILIELYKVHLEPFGSKQISLSLAIYSRYFMMLKARLEKAD